MLNRENRCVLKSLQGDYKKFARKITSAAFGRCTGNRAINENLTELFSMLLAAQEDGQPFHTAVPDPEMTIRETLLCFRPKRIGLIIGTVAAFIAIFCASAAAGVILYNMYSPITLARPEQLYYSEKTNTIVWTSVKNASSYEVWIDGNLATETAYTTYSLGGTPYDALEHAIRVSVVAKGTGRYRDSTNSNNIIIESNYPVFEGNISDFLSLSQSGISTNGHIIDESGAQFFAFYPYSTLYDTARVRFTPEYSFWGKVSDYVLSRTILGNNAEGSDKPFYFRAGTAYEYTLLKWDEWLSENQFVFSMDILYYDRLPEEAKYQTLAAGNSLIYFGSRYDCKFTAYRVESEEFSVQPTYFVQERGQVSIHLYPLDARFEKTFAPASNKDTYHALYIVKNSAREDRIFSYCENVVTVSADSESETVANGYIAIRTTPVDSMDDGRNLTYLKLAVYHYGSIWMYRNGYESSIGNSRYYGDFNVMTVPWQKSEADGSYTPTEIVIYTYEDVKLRMECFYPYEYTAWTTESIRLRPGLNVVYASNHSLLKAPKAIYFGLRSHDSMWDVTYGYRENCLIQSVVSYDRYILLNPYDEELELTATELVAKTS